MTTREIACLQILFQNLDEGFDKIQCVEAFANNSGLSRIGRPMDVVGFKPLIHEDTIGGLEPGEKALITRSGWRNSQGIIRAKVKAL